MNFAAVSHWWLFATHFLSLFLPVWPPLSCFVVMHCLHAIDRRCIFSISFSFLPKSPLSISYTFRVVFLFSAVVVYLHHKTDIAS